MKPSRFSTPPPSEVLAQGALPFNVFQNVLTYYVDLPCFLILDGDWKTWSAVVTLRQDKNTPADYENARQWRARIRYNERTLARVAKEKKALCPAHHGLHGLFVPVVKDGRCLGVLQSGVFLRDIPGESDLLRLWKELRGRAPAPQDEQFLGYARAMAETPVLDDTLVEALRELLELLGAFLTRSLDGRTAANRMAALQKTVFARRLSHRKWVEWQALQPKFFRFNDDPRQLMQWEVDELGIGRFPTTILAAKREGTGKEWTDWLAALSFQREARRLAPELGETLAHPFGNYGTLLLTSADPRHGPAQASAEIGEKAAAFVRRMSAKLGCRVWLGMGSTESGGAGLRDSYHEAVTALHLAVARNQEIVRYQDQDRDHADFGETGLRHKSDVLVQTLLEHGRVPASHHGGAFIQDVLLRTRGRPEATRRVLISTLHRLLAALEGRRRVPDGDLSELESGIILRMETAVGLNEMVGRFESALELLLTFLESPISGDKYFRLGRAEEAVCASLQEAWTLPVAARRFGFSNTTFSREFARHVGMPFSDFLLVRRLEKAKRLLRDGLSPQRVAEACGFRSANYFTQIFKRKVGIPPGRYGREQAA